MESSRVAENTLWMKNVKNRNILNPHLGWFGTYIAACPVLLIHNYIQKQEQVRLMEKEACMLQRLLETVNGRILAAFIRSAPWSCVATRPICHDFSYKE
jgi:hypothetical protein